MFLELYGFAFAGEGSDLYAPAAAALTVLFFRVAPHLIPKFAGELEDVGRNVCWKESSALREDRQLNIRQPSSFMVDLRAVVDLPDYGLRAADDPCACRSADDLVRS
jgi:hypothetical protein